MPLILGIAGSAGRMGQALLAAARESGCEAIAGGRSERFATADVIIDFTAPEYTLMLADAARGKALVTGTTGLNIAQQRAVENAAKHAAIVQSANFSIGVNVLKNIVEQTAGLLNEEYDIEIDEMHHRMKKDAPSGTALLLGRAAARGRGVEFADAYRFLQEGIGEPRARGGIGISARRGGEVVGTHTVTFAGPGETLEFTHRAHSRQIYAAGAIRAALWAHGQKPGLYSMRDVLFS